MQKVPARSGPGQAAADLCRSCHEPLFDRILDLGLQPVADRLVRADAPASADVPYPLVLVLCRSCMLLQLAPFEGEDKVRGHEDHSAISSTVAAHDGAWASELVQRFRLGPGSLVAEAEGSGDGVTRALVASGVRVLAAGECTAGSADLVVANHSLAHALDLDQAVTELLTPLAVGGTAALEFHHGARLLTDSQFDTICHPHRTYPSVAALVKALSRHGLDVYEATEIPVHGGSVRIYARQGGSGTAAAVKEIVAGEAMLGLDGISRDCDLARHVDTISTKLQAFLARARVDGRTVVGYGAPSRASTLLNYCQLTPELLPATVDQSTAKQGWALPGCRVPIHPPSLLTEMKPAFVLILAWTLADEIMAQLSQVRSWGGRFVVPLPDLRILA